MAGFLLQPHRIRLSQRPPLRPAAELSYSSLRPYPAQRTEKDEEMLIKPWIPRVVAVLTASLLCSWPGLSQADGGAVKGEGCYGRTHKSDHGQLSTSAVIGPRLGAAVAGAL